MATTYEEFSAKLDRLDQEFAKKMEEQNKKFFADKPDESTLSPEMKEHYEKFEKMIQEHTDKFNKKMSEHSEHFKQKFAELLEQQKNAQYPGENLGTMFRASRSFLFKMKMGSMYVDYKVQSRDHKKAIRVEEAMVDPQLPVTVLPMNWLEALRSSSSRLPTGYYVEEPVYIAPGYADRLVHGPVPVESNLNAYLKAARKNQTPEAEGEKAPNAIRAGPVVVYITGQLTPVVLNPIFVSEEVFQLALPPRPSLSGGVKEGTEAYEELDLRIGLDAIEQCSLYSELRPGGLLYSKLPHKDVQAAVEPPREILSRYGMKVGLSESPLVPRPWTRMKHMFIDELQRGPKMTEFVGHNPRNGTPWRFSQHTRYFRAGIWRETIRRNEMNEGLHAHSSWQKSPQQAVPDVSFLAPYP